MENTWFALYHVYSTAKSFDGHGLQQFEMDLKLAQRLGIKTLILEDYYADFIWGEYTNFWNEEMFRSMVRLTHDYGIRFIPYFDATELAIHGRIFKKYGKLWGSKGKNGKLYSAFSSIFLPYYAKRDFHTKLMCPASGWVDYLTQQAHFLLNQFEVDGIYLDRADYRVLCYDHLRDPNHFIQGIPNLVKRIQTEVKSTTSKNLLIMNDSCVNPDPTLIKCLKLVDFVLTELLPTDTVPNNYYSQFLVKYGDLIWAFRKILKPVFRFFMKFAFTTGSMTDELRIQRILDRLKPYVGQNIFIFSHRMDYEGFKVIRQIAQNNQVSCVYTAGLNYLRSIRDRFEIEK